IMTASPNMMMPDPEDDGRPFLPVVEDAHLPRLAIDAVKDGGSASVAVLVGSTREEWKLFSVMDPGAMSLDDDGLVKRLGRRLEAAAIQKVTSAYRASRASRGEPGTAPDLHRRIETDHRFRIPA